MEKTVFNIYLSAPKDAMPARYSAERVIERLAGQWAEHFEITPFFWDHDPVWKYRRAPSAALTPDQADFVAILKAALPGRRHPGGGDPSEAASFEVQEAAGMALDRPEGFRYYRFTTARSATDDPAAQMKWLKAKERLDELEKGFFDQIEGFRSAYQAIDDPAAFCRIFEEDLRQALQAKAKSLGLPEPYTTAAWWAQGSPYRGLEHYDQAHAPVFFGRDRAVVDILTRLRRKALERADFLLLIGPSGSGKSSLIRAGVLPLLTRPGVIEGVGLWRQAIFRPGNAEGDLMQGLADALLDREALPELTADGTEKSEIIGDLNANISNLVLMIKGGLSQAAGDLARQEDLKSQPPARLALFVDQLEEVFDATRFTPEEVDLFFNVLNALAKSGLVMILAALRSDCYARAQACPQLVELKSIGAEYDLLPPRSNELHEIITAPAKAAGLMLETPDEEEVDPIAALQASVFESLKEQAARKKGLVLLHGGSREQRNELIRGAARLLTRPKSVEGVGLWRHVVFTPGQAEGDVFDALIAAMLEEKALPELSADGSTAEELAGYLRDNPVSTTPLVKGGLSQAASDFARQEGLSSQPEARLLLVLDRMEEVFKPRSLSEDQAAGLAGVLKAMAKSGRVFILGAAAEAPDADSDLLAQASRFDLNAALAEQEAAAEAGSVVDRLLEEAEGLGADCLPLLSFTLDELYRRSPENRLTEAVLDEAGGVAEALNVRAEEIVGGLPAEAAGKVEEVMSALTAWTDDGKSMVYAGAVHHEAAGDPASVALADALVEAGLLVVYHFNDHPPILRPAHSVVFRRWKRLGAFIEGQSPQTAARAPAPASEGPAAAPQPEASPQRRPGKEKRAFNPPAVQWRRWMRRAAIAALLVVIGLVGYAGYKIYPRLFGPPKVPGTVQTEDGRVTALHAKTGLDQQVRDAARIKVLKKRLTDAEHSLALFFQEEAEKAMEERSYNKARIYWLNAMRRFDPDWEGDQKARVAGRYLSHKGYPVIFSLPREQDREYAVTAFDYGPSDRLIAVGADDKTVRLWDVVAGEEAYTMTGHKAPIVGVSFSPSGDRLASAAEDGSIRLWDPRTGEEVRAFEDAVENPTCLVFSPKGDLMAVGAEDGYIYLIDAESGVKSAILKRHRSAVTTVAFNRDQTLLASGGVDKEIRIWSARNGRLIKALEGHEDRVNRAAFSPDGGLLASASSDGVVRFWDLKTYQESGAIEDHTEAVTALAFSPDGAIVASGSEDQTVRLFDMATGESLAVIAGFSEGVEGIGFSPDGGVMATDAGAALRLWTTHKFEPNPRFNALTDGAVQTAYSPDGEWVASGGADQTVRVWDAVTGKLRHEFTGHNGAIYSLSFSPDGRLLASGSGDKTIRLWDVALGEQKDVLIGHVAVVYSVRFAPDGRTLASGSGDKTVRLWDVTTGESRAVLKGHGFPVLCLAFSPARMQLASGSSDKTIRLWNVKTGEELSVLASKDDSVYGDVKDLCYSPDGRLLAASMGAMAPLGGIIRIWDLSSRREAHNLKGHTDSVDSVAFSPDGAYLASASLDKTVRLWDMEAGRESAVFRIPEAGLRSIAYAPDGESLIAGAADGRMLTIALNEFDDLNHLDQTIKEMERAYRLGLVNIDVRPLKPLAYVPLDELGPPDWPAFHPLHWLTAAGEGKAEAMLQLGLVYDRAGLNDRALTWYEKAAQADNAQAQERYNRLKAYLEAGGV